MKACMGRQLKHEIERLPIKVTMSSENPWLGLKGLV